MTIGDAVINVEASSGTSFFFSKLIDHGEKEQKWHNLALEKLQMSREEWKKYTVKRLGFINKRLREKNEARAKNNNADKAMLKHYHVFAKRIKPLSPEPQLSEFYRPLEGQKMVNHYLLERVQAWQHMLFTSSLNKLQTRN